MGGLTLAFSYRFGLAQWPHENPHPIVEDEAPARELIATLARAEADVEIVGECSSGPAALSAVGKLKPRPVVP
jgi:hypothetical protein